MFAKATSVSNPLIYYFMIERFRREVKTVIWIMFFGKSDKTNFGSGRPIITSFRSFKDESVAATAPGETSGAGDVSGRVGDVIVECRDVSMEGNDVMIEDSDAGKKSTTETCTDLTRL